jgi:hypothetical protein
MGFCALQVEHQAAETSMRMGLPAFCAASNAAWVNGLWPAATAGKPAAQAAAAINTNKARRVSMLISYLIDMIS